MSSDYIQQIESLLEKEPGLARIDPAKIREETSALTEELVRKNLGSFVMPSDAALELGAPQATSLRMKLSRINSSSLVNRIWISDDTFAPEKGSKQIPLTVLALLDKDLKDSDKATFSAHGFLVLATFPGTMNRGLGETIGLRIHKEVLKSGVTPAHIASFWFEDVQKKLLPKALQIVMLLEHGSLFEKLKIIYNESLKETLVRQREIDKSICEQFGSCDICIYKDVCDQFGDPNLSKVVR